MERREDILISDLCEEIDYLHGALGRVEKERDYYKDEWWKVVEANIKAGYNGIRHVCAGMIVAGIKDTKFAKAILSSMNDGGKS